MQFDKKKLMDYVEANKNILKIIALLLIAMMVTSHIKGCQRRHMKQPIYPRPVQTALASKKDVPVYVDSFGTLSSPEDVDIKAQVTGKILEVNFVQGQEVSAGDLLFTIDPQEYQAQVDEQAGILEESIADLKLKKDTLERNRVLYEKQLISEQDFEQYRTDALAAEAKVQTDAAALEFAKVQLGYCYIRSPIDGLTGKRQVDAGNIISANTGPTLVNVKTIDRLYLDFTLPERDLPKVRKAMSEGKLEVQVTIDGDDGSKHLGELEFIDNTVDDETGTFSLRAIVNNEDRGLWAGQFARVRLILGTQKSAVLVPFTAAQLGKKGYYVFVVDKNKKADLRFVSVGNRDGDDVVIDSGVKKGETVVTVGQMGLAPGIPVTARQPGQEKKR
jgi:multidrug efflux system membrane fusion protein